MVQAFRGCARGIRGGFARMDGWNGPILRRRRASLARHLGRAVEFSGPVEDQTLENPDAEFPDAQEVFAFMDAQAKTPR